MAAYTYNEIRKVLRAIGFRLARSRKHETWEKILKSGTILQVRLSHKGKRTVPKGMFSQILKQMGTDRASFERLLRKRQS